MDSLIYKIEEQALMEYATIKGDESSEEQKHIQGWIEEYSNNNINQKKSLEILRQKKRSSKKNEPMINERNSIDNIHTSVKTPEDDVDFPIKYIDLSEIKKSIFHFPISAIEKIETAEFDIFKCDQEVGSEYTLTLISAYTFSKYCIFNKINHLCFDKFIQQISKGYTRNNPYHTDLHAADVLHTCYLITKLGDIEKDMY